MNTESGGDYVHGVTAFGGTNGCGAVYEIDPAFKETVFYSFDCTHGEEPNGGLIADKNLQHFYGVTVEGGTSSDGAVYQLAPDGKQKVLYNFLGGNDGAVPSGELVQDSQGNFYGVTTNGGSANLGTVYKLSPKGKETVLHTFTGQPGDGSLPFGGLLLVETKADLELYGTTQTGGTNDQGTVFQVTP